MEKEAAIKAGGYRRHWSAEGPRENWFTKDNQILSIFYRGRNNHIPGIVLRTNIL